MPTSPSGPAGDEYSRRKFLRAAVIGTAGVAGAAGVAGVVLAQRGGSVAPGIISIRQVSGTSDGDYTMLFEDTNCGTSGDCNQCGNYSTTNFTVTTKNGNTHTNPGSFFVVLAINGLPGNSTGITYSILAQEKLDSAGSYSNIPTTATSSLPFAYQSSGGNVQVYEYTPGKVTGSGPYALNCSPLNSPNKTVGIDFANGAADTFKLTSTQDVLIFIHVNWGAGAIGSSGTTETIDFRITLTNTGDSTTAVETTSTTGKQS